MFHCLYRCHMSLFEWREKYAVKIDRFDKAHKKLIDLINEIHDIIKLKKGSEALGGILSELNNYTTTHFNDEIYFMEKYNYPDIEEHKAEHEKFIFELNQIKEKYNQNANLLNLQLLYILKDWLVNHIMVTDMKYSEFFREKEIT